MFGQMKIKFSNFWKIIKILWNSNIPSDNLDTGEINSHLQELNNMRKECGPEYHKWLENLYNHYVQQFISDNNRIWTTGSIMIPLSFSPFAIFPSANSLHFIYTILLAIASISIYFAWLVLADNHKAFQNKSLHWIIAIQKTIGINKIGKNKINGSELTDHINVHKMRYLLLKMLLAGWCIAIFYSLPTKH